MNIKMRDAVLTSLKSDVIWLYRTCTGMLSSFTCALHHEWSLSWVLSHWANLVESRLYLTLKGAFMPNMKAPF